MKIQSQLLSSDREALVVSTTRRWVTIALANGETSLKKITGRGPDLCIGDKIKLSAGGEIEELLPRSNLLFRQIGTKRKTLAANLDLLLVITAPPPLLNHAFNDRVLVACEKEEIPSVVVFNKEDLVTDKVQDYYDYPDEFFRSIRISAKYSRGLEQIESMLGKDEVRIAAFTGVSGVGKSTLLNSLIPEIERETSEVSEKTGQGRQTTSQAQAFLAPKLDTFIVDLPGIQNFGISHIRPKELSALMPDFEEAAQGCEFGDCSHIEEEHCGVRAALDAGTISEERFNSYLNMLEDIERFEAHELKLKS